MADFVVFPRRSSFSAEPQATAGACGFALNELVAAQPPYASAPPHELKIELPPVQVHTRDANGDRVA
jgi:hypothetical protein